jgi:hypothetical protein
VAGAEAEAEAGAGAEVGPFHIMVVAIIIGGGVVAVVEVVDEDVEGR